jgi:carbon-monoxide dehydrogenase large subunit
VQPTDAKDQYDSGDYRIAFERCLNEIGWHDKAKLCGQSIDGRYHGLGVSCFIEGGAAGPKETARLEINDDGTFSVYLGTTSVGQGVETIFAQIAADALEVPIDRIRHVHHGSTHYVSEGFGAYHSRSTVMGGSALLDATKNLHAAVRAAGAKRFVCDASAIAIEGDKVSSSDGRTFALRELAGLSAEGTFHNHHHTYSYGTHAAYVAVDPKIGRIEIIDYVVVQDVGRAINPLTLRGQMIGAVVQGLGGACLEHLQYDDEGQFLTGSLADYLLPTASDFPNVRCVITEDYPSPNNPLGAKGAGEGGIIAAGGALANAVAHALAPFGAEPRTLPLTPSKVWELVGRKEV